MEDSSNGDQQPAASRWPRSIASLEEPQFRWLLGSNAAFFLAIQGQILTRTYLAWDLTGEEMSLAYVNIAFAVPMLIFSIFGGAFSDRTERRFLALFGQSFVVLSEAIVLVLLLLGSLEFWHILAAGALSGAVIPFSMPARTAIVFNVVGPSRLGNATALSGGVMNVCRVVGPMIMGFAIDFFDVTGAYIVAVSLHIMAFFCLFGVKRCYADKKSRKNLGQEISSGFRYVFERRALMMCILFGLLPMFLAMPFQNLLVIFADEVWNVGERGLGIMMSAAGLGGVVGSVWMARRGENTNRTKLMIGTTLLFGICLGVFAVTPLFAFALVPLVIANAFASASQTLNNTAAQLLVEDEFRGRVSAIMLMTFGLMPLGVVPMALMASAIGVKLAIVIASATLVAVVILFYSVSPSLRDLDEHVKLALRRHQPG
ncbi:MAG: MFS transporter [Pseudomonadales bacterium]